MNSWQTLLMVHLVQGRYVATRLPTEYDWWTLWALATVDSVNSDRQAETKDTDTLTSTSAP